MAKSVARVLLIPCALAFSLIGTAACTAGPKLVSRSNVESQISQKMTDASGRGSLLMPGIGLVAISTTVPSV